MARLVAGKWGRAALLEYVLLEVVTALLVRRGLDAAVDAANILLYSVEVDFVPCLDLFEDSFKTFASQGSGWLSMVDATITTLARRNDPGFVATFDVDFSDLSGVTVVPD